MRLCPHSLSNLAKHAGWTAWLVGATPYRRGLFFGGVFPPVKTPIIIGYLHGIAGLVAIFGSPIAFTLIGRSLARSQGRFLSARRLRWATLVAWTGLLFFLVSLFFVSLSGQLDIRYTAAPVGEPRQQVFDRDLLHLVHSCVECDTERQSRMRVNFRTNSTAHF